MWQSSLDMVVEEDMDNFGGTGVWGTEEEIRESMSERSLAPYLVIHALSLRAAPTPYPLPPTPTPRTNRLFTPRAKCSNTDAREDSFKDRCA